MAGPTGFNAIIEGDDALQERLRLLHRNTGKKYLNPAFTKAAKYVLKYAKERVPKKSKRLWRGLKSRAIKRSRVQFGRLVVMPSRDELKIGDYTRTGDGNIINKSYYPAAMEFGWKTKSGKHIPARPFLRPALRRNRRILMVMIERVARDRMRKDLKRVKARKKSR